MASLCVSHLPPLWPRSASEPRCWASVTGRSPGPSHAVPQIPSLVFGLPVSTFHHSLSAVDRVTHTLSGPALGPGTQGHTDRAGCTAGQQLLDSLRVGGI